MSNACPLTRWAVSLPLLSLRGCLWTITLIAAGCSAPTAPLPKVVKIVANAPGALDGAFTLASIDGQRLPWRVATGVPTCSFTDVIAGSLAFDLTGGVTRSQTTRWTKCDGSTVVTTDTVEGTYTATQSRAMMTFAGFGGRGRLMRARPDDEPVVIHWVAVSSSGVVIGAPYMYGR